MNFILQPVLGIALNGAALYGLTYAVEEITYTGGFKTFLLGGLVLGLINVFIKPVIKMLSLPLVFLTGGVFLIVINAGILWFLSYLFSVAQFRDVSLTFPNFGTYVIGAIVFGALNWVFHQVIKKN